MSEHIPAWKKIGLKVKQELEEDPLALTTHLENANLSVKDIKKINKQKRKLQESNNLDSKKEPKRVKKPKSERAPPPEKDQLTYLKQYENDREHWKFSKQKQNWILKNIKSIPKDYESALYLYLSGLQGGSRTRAVEDLNKVVARWNEVAEIAEKKIEEELERKLRGEETKEDDDKKKEKKENKENKVKQESKEDEVDYDYAHRCRELIKTMTGEAVEMKGLIEKEVEEEKVEEKKEEQKKEPEVEEEKKEQDKKDNLIIEEVDVSLFKPEDDKKDKKKKKKKSKKNTKSD